VANLQFPGGADGARRRRCGDTLTGSQQSDWFFVFSNDEVTDKNKNEFVN
jgi:hypothetical protein